jgi:hypothetical protein
VSKLVSFVRNLSSRQLTSFCSKAYQCPKSTLSIGALCDADSQITGGRTGERGQFPLHARHRTAASALPICRRLWPSIWLITLQAGASSADRTRSLAGVTGKRELFNEWPETFGFLVRPPRESGAWRRRPELQKARHSRAFLRWVEAEPRAARLPGWGGRIRNLTWGFRVNYSRSGACLFSLERPLRLGNYASLDSCASSSLWCGDSNLKRSESCILVRGTC